MMRRLGVTLLTIAAIASALATQGRAVRQGAGCNPAIQFCDPGVLPGGVYATRYFIPGMRVKVPAGGWSSPQDSPTEFKLLPPGASNPDSPAIRFWIDPHASTPCTDQPVRADLSTPARMFSWLRGNPNLIVSAPRRVLIAGHVPALSVDLIVKPTAPECDPACGGACIDYFLFSAPGVHTEPYGTGSAEPARFYFARIGKPFHLFVIGVDAPNQNVLATLTPTAATVAANLRLPKQLPPSRP